MKTFNYTITDTLGLHARPAGLFVKEAKKFSSKITLTKDDKTVNATQLMKLMGLGIKKGTNITITAEGADEDDAVADLKAFLEENL